MDIDGSREKECPFCRRTFPSDRSCSMHIRERHMSEASKQRAMEAAEKETQRGATTARAKWGEGEISRFKEALKKLGPSDNTKLAEAVGTRDKYQIATYKSRFFKANPTWLQENYHPAQPASNAPRSRRSSTRSPASTQDRSPAANTFLQPPAGDARRGQQQPLARNARAGQTNCWNSHSSICLATNNSYPGGRSTATPVCGGDTGHPWAEQHPTLEPWRGDTVPVSPCWNGHSSICLAPGYSLRKAAL